MAYIIRDHSLLCFAMSLPRRPVAGGGGGFKAPLTRMVCTPCYRAPEVVMSRGGYTGVPNACNQFVLQARPPAQLRAHTSA